MLAVPASILRHDAYRLGALSLLGAIAVIGAALAFQYLGGLEPCALCLTERYAYYAGIPVLFATLVALAAGYSRWAAVGFCLVALAFLANALLGGYHTGAEWGFWPGPSTCSGALKPLGSPADLLRGGPAVRVIRCDQASWWFLGLSFAGWNALISTGLCITLLLAGRMTVRDAPARDTNLFI